MDPPRGGSTRMPTHHLSAASTDVNHGSKCPCCVWAAQLACTFLGDEGVRFRGWIQLSSRQVPGSREVEIRGLAGSKGQRCSPKRMPGGSRSSRSGHDPKTKTGLTALLMPLWGSWGSSDITGETTKHACGFEMKQWLEVGRRHGAAIRVACFYVCWVPDEHGLLNGAPPPWIKTQQDPRYARHCRVTALAKGSHCRAKVALVRPREFLPKP